MLKKSLKLKVLAVMLLLAAFPFAGAFACSCEKADDWYTSMYSAPPDQNAGINDYSSSTYQYDYKTQTKVNVDKTVDPTISGKSAKTAASSNMAVVEANDADTGSSSSDSMPYDNYPN